MASRRSEDNHDDGGDEDGGDDVGDADDGGGDADDGGGEDLTSGQVVQLVDQRLLLDGDHWTLLQIASQPVNFITRTDLQVR